MKTLAALPPRTLLRLRSLLRIGAVIAAAWGFRAMFSQGPGWVILAGFALFAALEIGADRLRKRIDAGTSRRDRS
ncbi:hypothetical protein [Thiomonas sp.]|uniref:hypothetical protein n=1 Tax=Thiomonas sp. TaxID=2047785 RepID=UPI002602C76B|nr:hypothetical protein [Thiomonas sp.]